MAKEVESLLLAVPGLRAQSWGLFYTKDVKPTLIRAVISGLPVEFKGGGVCPAPPSWGTMKLASSTPSPGPESLT